MNEDEDGYDYTIAPASDGTNEGNSLTAQEDENHWNRKYKVDSGDLSVFADGLVGVVVVTDDDEDNSGSTDGWSPKAHRDAPAPTGGDDLDLEDMDDADLLVEIDKLVEEAGKVFVTPRSDSDGGETESSNPFVKLDFSSEGREYEVCPDGTMRKRRSSAASKCERRQSCREVQGLALPGQRGRDHGERRGRRSRTWCASTRTSSRWCCATSRTATTRSGTR